MPAISAEALHHQAGQQVCCSSLRGDGRTRADRGGPGARSIATPQLRYADWVQTRMRRVETQGEGRIGYLHLRAMGGNDMASFVRDFYANVDRDGLIIDVRRNRGGNIDSWIIEKLLRRTWAFWQTPSAPPYWNMQQTFRGHLVVLTDALTYSDGETFAAGVKALGLGPVVGTRTGGAGIWLSDRNRLADGGSARIAEFGQFESADGRWLIEGRGVEPRCRGRQPAARVLQGPRSPARNRHRDARKSAARTPHRPATRAAHSAAEPAGPRRRSNSALTEVRVQARGQALLGFPRFAGAGLEVSTLGAAAPGSA